VAYATLGTYRLRFCEAGAFILLIPARADRTCCMKTPGRDLDHEAMMVHELLLQRRRRLGSALQQLAADLVRERRRSAELERELSQLRALGTADAARPAT
jgi:hypothetical protein